MKEELEAALALYLLGMEVADADGNLDKTEYKTIFLTASLAAGTCSSTVVRRIAKFLSQLGDPEAKPNPLKKYEKDNKRQPEDVYWAVGRQLRNWDEADVMRYLETAVRMAGMVGEATRSSRADSKAISRDEANVAGASIGKLSVDVNVSASQLRSWIQANEY